MITFSKLGNKGNLGNQFFQIASTIGIADKYGHQCGFPEWSYSKYFKNKIAVYEKDENFEIIKEAKYHYLEWNLGNHNYDLDGWLQSEKYFNRVKTKELFEFAEFAKDVYLNHDFLFSKKTILVSVRRGDFVKNPYYYQISHLFYFKAIVQNFPDWKQRNIIFTSDDIAYCKYHYSFLKNSFFLENVTPIEQIVLGSKCDDFVISNSTFSWWIAWLGEKESSKVIRPIKNFSEYFAKTYSDKDYFPERWVSFDDKKYNLGSQYALFFIRGFAYDFIVETKFLLMRIKNKLKKKKYISK